MIELIHAAVGSACCVGSKLCCVVTGVSARSSFNRFSIVNCSSSRSFRPPGAKIFTPLSVQRLWDAETTTPPEFSTFDKYATTGVGITPTLTAVNPLLLIADMIASDNAGPDSRVSRPMIHRSAGSTSLAAVARHVTNLWLSISGAGPRTPSVPNDSVMSTPSRFTAWSTAVPYELS